MSRLLVPCLLTFLVVLISCSTAPAPDQHTPTSTPVVLNQEGVVDAFSESFPDTPFKKCAADAPHNNPETGIPISICVDGINSSNELLVVKIGDKAPYDITEQDIDDLFRMLSRQGHEMARSRYGDLFEDQIYERLYLHQGGFVTSTILSDANIESREVQLTYFAHDRPIFIIFASTILDLLELRKYVDSVEEVVTPLVN